MILSKKTKSFVSLWAVETVSLFFARSAGRGFRDFASLAHDFPLVAAQLVEDNILTEIGDTIPSKLQDAAKETSYHIARAFAVKLIEECFSSEDRFIAETLTSSSKT